MLSVDELEDVSVDSCFQGPGRREMDIDSKAMADSDWRRGGPERPSLSNRPIPSRDRGRDSADRPPMREREVNAVIP